MKRLAIIIALCTTPLCTNVQGAELPVIKNVKAGDYLSSRFAQTNHDWKNAHIYINELIKAGIAPTNILQRAMILAMGAGNADEAIKIAHQIKSSNPDNTNTIKDIFLVAEAFKSKDYKKTKKLLDNLPNDGTVKFIRPFLNGWLSAAQGITNVKHLQETTAQLYHGILISDFLDDHSDVERLIDKALKVEDINGNEIHRIADLYGHVGLKDKAIKIYNLVLKNDPDNQGIKKNISDLEQGTNEPLFDKVVSANEGMAKAFHDIAMILYNDNNNESARIFAQISLYIAPQSTETKLLLAMLSANSKQYDEALLYYTSIPKSDDEYLTAQYKIVDIYEATERFDNALTLLKNLSDKHQDVDTLIKIGDLHRNQKQYDLALKSYDIAIKKMGGEITPNYWHLHYARGISYEQNNDWSSAEKELKAALSFQPDHPYILNYLGYAWADKGINLQESLKMIKRAVDLQPSDGYITDSLGWVMYRVKDYKNAVSALERAVELLPYDPTINDHLGDAYWKVGRSLEAKFQWRRAKNHSEDEIQVKAIEQKLASGLK